MHNEDCLDRCVYKNCLDQRVYNIYALPHFQKLCKESLTAIDRIETLKRQLEGKCTDNQEAVYNKYLARAEQETDANKKILRTRLVLCAVVAVVAAVVMLLGVPYAVPLWLGIMFLSIFLRPGYARKKREHYIGATFEIITSGSQYREAMRSAIAEDERLTRIERERIRTELNRLEKENSEDSMMWLQAELMKTVKEIRRESSAKGFSRFMNQTDASIAEVLIDKMGRGIGYNEFPLTYGQVIQKGKIKAVNDWIGCAQSLSSIEDSLTQLFKGR